MITITKNNIYRSIGGFENINNLSNVKVISPKEIVKYFTDYVQLGESVTLKRLFNIISPNFILFNQVFYNSMGGFPIEPYLQEIENNKTSDINFDYLEIHWNFEVYDNDIDMTPSFHGLSLKDDNAYSLDFVPLNNIKDCIVKLNHSVDYYHFNNIIEKNKENIGVDIEYLGEKQFTVFDLYNAILTEISFHGGPQDKKEVLDEIMEDLDNVKYEVSDENVKDFKSFEEVILEFEKNDEYLVVYKDYRDRVDKNRLKSIENLSKIKRCLINKFKIYDYIENSKKTNFYKQYNKLTNIEYDIQTLYDEVEDISYHRFWETPKCTCPKIDNIEIFPSEMPIYDLNCTIHNK